MNTPKIRLSLLGIAFGILLALLLAPQTRWLVRLQTLTVLHQYRPLGCASYSASPAGDTHAYDAVAARHPDDFAIQYARATFTEDKPPLMNLRALTRRFPDNPALYANILREESQRTLLSSVAASKLSGDSTPSFVMPASSPQEIADYNQDAAAGERADPDNAYFPLMLAYGLFAAHQNADALAAVERASVKPAWNEYLMENTAAQWRLHTEAFDDPGAMPQAAIWGSVLLPEYQRLRQTARIVAYQAVLKEQAGHLEEGFALREALRRCGDLMRVQSATLIGSLVGIAISSISEARPGGVPPLKQGANEASEQMAQQRVEAYCAYVTKIGHPKAAQSARDEEAARRRVQGLVNMDHPFVDFTGPLLHLTWWWIAGIALLLNAAWLLVLGFLAAGRARLPLAPKPPIGWKAVLVQGVLAVGLWAFLALLYICIGGIWITAVYHADIDWRMIFGVAGIFGLVAWLVFRALRRSAPPQRKSILRMALLLPVLAGIVYGLYWLVQWVAWPLAEMPQGLWALTGLSGGVNDSDTEQALQAQTLWICTAAMLAVPLLLALVLSVAALVRRLPVLGTLTAGFQRLAVPVACLLVISYSGVLISTSLQERRVTDFNRQLVSEGGRFFAAQVGQAWPGPVP